jgi:hypothetical protein
MTPANLKAARRIVLDWRAAKPATRRVLVKEDSVLLQTLIGGAWLEAQFATPIMAASALLSLDFKWRAARA